MKFKTIILTAMTTAVATLTHAQTGTVGLVDAGTPSVSPGTDINGATSYTIGNLESLGDTTGVFVGLPAQDYGSFTFSPSVGTSFTFSSPEFGTFTSSSIEVLSSSEGFVSLHILGDYSSGTFDSEAIVDDPASVDYSFTQNPPATGGIADSGEFSIPPTAVPEPGSLALLGVGATALCGRRRRKG